MLKHALHRRTSVPLVLADSRPGGRHRPFWLRQAGNRSARSGVTPDFQLFGSGNDFIDDMSGNFLSGECSTVLSRSARFPAGSAVSFSTNPRARLLVVRTWKRIRPDSHPPVSNPNW